MIDSKILESGWVKGILFDKTGTLTENSVQIFGYNLNIHFDKIFTNLKDLKGIKDYQILMEMMSCCHSL